MAASSGNLVDGKVNEPSSLRLKQRSNPTRMTTEARTKLGHAAQQNVALVQCVLDVQVIELVETAEYDVFL